VSKQPSAKPSPGKRSDYRLFQAMETRWGDNDIYGHLNNTVHYRLFDTLVNSFLLKNGLLDLQQGEQVFLVVENGCRYFGEMAYPDVVHGGLRIVHLGNSSARYEIGLFRNDEETAAAEGYFVHVLVDRATHKPVTIDPRAREVLSGISC